LTHGFQTAFYVLAALAILGAVVAALMVESPRRQREDAEVQRADVALEPAA
jgi:hypothetical protein